MDVKVLRASVVLLLRKLWMSALCRGVDAGVLLLPILVFSSSLGRGSWDFVHAYDDEHNFSQDMIKRLSWKNLLLMFSSVRINVYEPFSWIVKSLIVAVNGGRVESLPFRFATLLLHASNSLLLHRVAISVLDLIGVAGVLGRLSCSVAVLVWSLHPVHIEVLGWPSALPYALCGLCTLLSTKAYICSTTSSRAVCRSSWALLSVVSYISAVLCKSSALTAAPSFIICIDALMLKASTSTARQSPAAKGAFGRQSLRGKPQLAAKLALCVCGLLLFGVALWANRLGVDHNSDVVSLSFLQRLARSQVLLWKYLHHMVCPTGLRPHYALQPDDGVLILSLAGTVVVTLLLATYPLLAVCWVAYLGSFLPMLGIFQHGMVQGGGDRYAYLPSMPIAVALAYGISRLLQNGQQETQCSVALPSAPEAAGEVTPRTKQKSAPPPKGPGSMVKPVTAATKTALPEFRPPSSGRKRLLVARAAALLAWVGALSVLSLRQLEMWRNEKALLQAGLAQDPSDWRFMEMLAEVLLKDGDRRRATALMERTLVEAPAYANQPKLAASRAKNYIVLGRPDEACNLLAEALKEHPTNYLLLNDVALCNLRDVEKRSESKGLLELALQMAPIGSPNSEKIQSNLEYLSAWNPATGEYNGHLLW